MKRLLILLTLLIMISASVYATEYSDKIDKHFTKSGSMLWKPSVNGTIENLRIVGDIHGDGEIQVHMIKEGNQYLLFKRSISNEGVQPKDHIEFEEGTNIGLILSYGNSRWDKDNDGIASQDEGIDFELEPLFFDNFYDEYLCTLWEVYNLDREEIYSECYGSSKCCKFVGYDPIVQDWDEDYILFKGEKNSGSKNIVIARIIYFDGVNVEYSNHDGLPTSFIGSEIQKQMNFTYESVFQSGNYFLRVTVDDDTIFQLKEIKYEIKDNKEEVNETPITPVNPREIIREKEALELKKKDETKIFPKFTQDSSYFYIESLFNTTKISVNNDKIIIDDVIIKEDVLRNVWFKIELKNNNDTYQSLKIDSNYYNKALLDFKIPIELLKNNTLFVDNNVDNIYAIKYNEDESYTYFRVESKLEDLNFNIISKDLEKEYMTGLGKINLSPITYFLISIVLAVIIFVAFNIPKKVYEKYKAIRFIEKEAKIAEDFIKKEEKAAGKFIKKEEQIIASKFKKKPKKTVKKVVPQKSKISGNTASSKKTTKKTTKKKKK